MLHTIYTTKLNLAVIVATSMFVSGCVSQPEQARPEIPRHYSTIMSRHEGMRVLKEATQGNEVAYLRRGDTWINFGLFESRRSVLPDWDYVQPLQESDEFIHTHPDSPFPSLADIAQYFDLNIPRMIHTVRHPYGSTTFYLPHLSKEDEWFISARYNPEHLTAQFQEEKKLGKSSSEAMQTILNMENKKLGGAMVFSFESDEPHSYSEHSAR